MSAFNYSDAFKVQEQHMEEWALLLKPEAYTALRQAVQNRNEQGYRTPLDVCRGVEIDSIVKTCVLDAMAIAAVEKANAKAKDAT